jgi:hypothetical protein
MEKATARSNFRDAEPKLVLPKRASQSRLHNAPSERLASAFDD